MMRQRVWAKILWGDETAVQNVANYTRAIKAQRPALKVQFTKERFWRDGRIFQSITHFYYSLSVDVIRRSFKAFRRSTAV